MRSRSTRATTTLGPDPSSPPSAVGDVRRRVVLLLGVAPLLATARPAAASTGPVRQPIEVWYASTCGCCKDWMRHLEQAGFAVTGRAEGNAAVRRRLGLPERFGSCHTAIVEGYLVEGHVPAADIRRLLATRPAALGLAVPGMPIGSPGMDQPIYQGRRDPYDVLLVRRDGNAEVFARYR